MGRYKQATEGKNAPILFYGKVIDQDGNPVASVNVKLRVQQIKFDPQYFVLPKYIRFDRTTGPDGLFSLDGAFGRGIDIESITKSGYQLEPNAIFDYGASSGATDNPIIFVLWEKGRERPMIEGDKHFLFIPDGRLYAVDLSSQSVTQATNSEGDFQFRLTRPKGVKKWDKFDWAFDFGGQGGNVLQKSEEGYFGMLFSPKDGYTNSYNETHHASDAPWIENGREQFYIKLRDGKAYGKLSVAWDTVAATAGPKANEAGIRIQYTINPAGSPLVR
jgi:hypothetical protein